VTVEFFDEDSEGRRYLDYITQRIEAKNEDMALFLMGTTAEFSMINIDVHDVYADEVVV